MHISPVYVNDIKISNKSNYINTLLDRFETAIRLPWRLLSVGPKTVYCPPSVCFSHMNSVRQQTVDWPVVESPALRSRRTSSFVNFPFCPFRSDFFLRFSCPSRAITTRRRLSIDSTRLSTHIFDCSANMTKFIPRPSSSSGGHYVARTMLRLLVASGISFTYPAKSREFVRSERCAQSNSILLRL